MSAKLEMVLGSLLASYDVPQAVTIFQFKQAAWTSMSTRTAMKCVHWNELGNNAA